MPIFDRRSLLSSPCHKPKEDRLAKHCRLLLVSAAIKFQFLICVISFRQPPQPTPHLIRYTSISPARPSLWELARREANMATMANNDRESTQPSCQNCGTQTTPLWRRDEMGSVLCNACGLFLKLHGRPRPISLKTDVIKSRNRVKTMRPDLAKQRKVRAMMAAITGPAADRRWAIEGADVVQQNQAMAAAASDLNGLDPNGVNTAARRVSQQRPSNGHVDDPNSPISRTGTPNMYGAHGGLPLYHGIDDTQFQTQGLPGFSVPGTSPGRAPSPLNGEMPQTSESLLAANASLKTRVSELEVIQELYRSRLAELEQGEANSRQAQEMSDKTEVQLRAQLDTVTESEAQLRKELEESHRRENMLKRRLDDLEAEFRETKVAMQAYESGRAKKPRLEVDEAEMQEMKEEQSPVAETVPEEPHAQ